MSQPFNFITIINKYKSSPDNANALTGGSGWVGQLPPWPERSGSLHDLLTAQGPFLSLLENTASDTAMTHPLQLYKSALPFYCILPTDWPCLCW